MFLVVPFVMGQVAFYTKQLTNNPRFSVPRPHDMLFERNRSREKMLFECKRSEEKMLFERNRSEEKRCYLNATGPKRKDAI